MKKTLEQNWLLWLIIAIGAFFRFYKLDWGEGHFSHPDEYHIAAAVNRLSFPSQMNPDLFSYGSFTVYLIYFTKLALSIFNFSAKGGPTSGWQFSIFNPILIGRFYSALFSTLSTLVVFLISQRLFKKKSFSYLTAFLAATMPGLIQQAHFTTPESILTFWLFLTLYFWIKWLEGKRLRFLYFSAISLGLALGTKIVALTFLPILILLPLTNLRFKTPPRLANAILGGGEKIIKLFLLPLLITSLAFFIVFPYAFLNYQSFRNTTIYETGVGRGNPLVFYTRQFINTTPILFQYQRILPYALGPVVVVFGTIGLLLMSIEVLSFLGQRHLRGGRSTPRTVEGFSANFTSEESLPPAGAWRRNRWRAGRTTIRGGFREKGKTFLILAFLFYFLPNAFLFTKWTRFVAPAFPFFAIFTTYLLSKMKSRAFLITNYLLLITSALWALMFFSIYLRSDVRITATDWINQNFSPDSFILTGGGNMIEVPLQGDFQKEHFDFYNLEKDLKLQRSLFQFLAQADYFIVQSRRVFANHQRLPGQFPFISRFYDFLFSDQLGFIKIKEFDSYPQLKIGSWRLAIPDEMAEETWSVFDHPVIRIYKKVTPFTKETYEKFFKI